MAKPGTLFCWKVSSRIIIHYNTVWSAACAFALLILGIVIFFNILNIYSSIYFNMCNYKDVAPAC